MENLPTELQLLILRHLRLGEIGRLIQTSRSMCAVVMALPELPYHMVRIKRKLDIARSDNVLALLYKERRYLPYVSGALLFLEVNYNSMKPSARERLIAVDGIMTRGYNLRIFRFRPRDFKDTLPKLKNVSQLTITGEIRPRAVLQANNFPARLKCLVIYNRVRIVEIPDSVTHLDVYGGTGAKTVINTHSHFPGNVQSWGTGNLSSIHLSGVYHLLTVKVSIPPGLQFLELAYCPLNDGSLQDLKLPASLKSLKLLSNQLTTLDGLALPRGLQRLNIQVNELGVFDIAVLGICTQLISLVLDACEISRIENPDFSRFPNLEGLILTSNKLESVAGYVMPLHARRIDLRWNPITDQSARPYNWWSATMSDED